MSGVITPMEKDYSQWYNDIVKKASLAENSAVRGCMVIKPYGFALWENMRDALDKMIKETGHQNAYFPLFIPKSFFSKEASHVKGFAKECAIVTHYRLKNGENNSIIVDPDSKLEEELIVRPTSETIIWNTYKEWIQSYRDLPLLINQWANVVRWEMRTRAFLRTSEFLWQEGHTAHATKEEAIEEAEKMLNVYVDFVENYLAIPVITGIKSVNERFAGALETYCIEALMQDGKALQAGTSHFLGQNFAKAFDVQFLNKENKKEYVWATSWGTSTRLIGALIMAHSDNEGLVLPPKIAPIQIIFIPIYKNQDKKILIDEKVKELINKLKTIGIRTKYDNSENERPGWKYAEYELKGVPLRVVIGEKDLEKNQLEIFRRDTKEKNFISLDSDISIYQNLLNNIQSNIFNKAKKFQQEHITEANNLEEFINILDNKTGFVSAHWDGTPETEEKIKELTKATIRCIPLNFKQEEGKCIFSNNYSNKRVLFARAY